MPQLLMLLSETNWSAVELVAGEIRLEECEVARQTRGAAGPARLRQAKLLAKCLINLLETKVSL